MKTVWTTDTAALCEAVRRFDGAAYWADKEFKGYVVVLEAGPARKPEREEVLVRARSRDSAIACAKRYTFLKRPRVTRVRWSNPHDHGCNAVSIQVPA